MDHVAERLAQARKALFTVQHIIDVDKVLMANKRGTVLAYLQNFQEGIVPVIHVMPPVVRDGDKNNITREIKNLRATAKSLIEASLDRAMKRDRVAMATIELVDKVRKLRRTLKTVINERQASGRTTEELIRSPSIIDELPASIIPMISAAKPKFNKSLTSFKDLENYQDFMRQIGDAARRIDAEAPKSEPPQDKSRPAPDLSAPPARAPLMDNGPSNNEVINTRSEKMLEESQRRLAEILRQVSEELPSQPTFGKRSYRLVEHVPLMLVTQNFVPDSLLKQVKAKFVRPLMPDTPGYTPGVHRKTNTPMISPVLIVHNQLMLAVPLKTAMQPAELKDLLDTVLPALSGAVGEMVPIEIGVNKRKFTDRTQPFKFGQGQGKMPTNRTVELKAPPVIPSNLKGKARRNALLNLETERRRAAAEKSFKEHERAAELEQRKENKRIAKFEAGRRLFFVNKRYSGVAWIWLVRREAYPSWSRVNFVSINLPMDNDMLPMDTNIPFGNKLIRQKEEREQAQSERINQLRQKREGLTGPIRAELVEWGKLAKVTYDKLRRLKEDYDSHESLLLRQKNQLNKLHDKTSHEYRTLEANIAATQNIIDELESDIEEESKSIPAINKERHTIEQQMRELTLKVAKERREKYTPNWKKYE
jgi:hypothetical protein